MTDSLPAPDQVPGAPHPRDTGDLVGQTAAEQVFLDAFNAGRVHHAWLLSGPSGIGKATMAYHLARFLLATPPAQEDGLFGAPAPIETLAISPGHPVCARMAAQSEPGLRVVTRTPNPKTGKMRDEIVVDDIRKLAEFFHLSAADGGHRVVIVDSADEMNISASNALLKMLEEPPDATTILLIAHQPSRLLPTIRSRCRTLRLSSLGPPDLHRVLQSCGVDHAGVDPVALAELAAGSAGAAMALLNLGGLTIYGEILTLLGSMPRLDRPRALALANAAAQRGAEAKLDLLIRLINTALARLARQGATGSVAQNAGPNEAEIFARLCPTPTLARLWAQEAGDVSARLAHGRAVNLDPVSLVLDTLIRLNDIASQTRQAHPA